MSIPSWRAPLSSPSLHTSGKPQDSLTQQTPCRLCPYEPPWTSGPPRFPDSNINVNQDVMNIYEFRYLNLRVVSKGRWSRWTYVKESYDSDVMGIDELSCGLHGVEHWDIRACTTLHPMDYSLRWPPTWWNAQNTHKFKLQHNNFRLLVAPRRITTTSKSAWHIWNVVLLIISRRETLKIQRQHAAIMIWTVWHFEFWMVMRVGFVSLYVHVVISVSVLIDISKTGQVGF